MPDRSHRRFELDRGAERATATLRLAGAVAVGVAGIVILVDDPGTIGWVVGLAGIGASIGWIFAFRRGRKRARTPEQHYLELSPTQLTLADGAQRHQIVWDDVTEVAVDENKLVVMVRRRGAEALTVEPRYRGVGVYELAAAIRGAWEDASEPRRD